MRLKVTVLNLIRFVKVFIVYEWLALLLFVGEIWVSVVCATGDRVSVLCWVAGSVVSMDEDFAAQAARRWAVLDSATDELTLRVGIRLERITRRQDELFVEALRPFGHRGVRTMEDFRFLAVLVRIHPSSISSTEASKLLRITKAATSTRTDRFVASGLAERSVREYDRRSIEISASPLGLEIAMECIAAINDAHQTLLGGLPKGELGDLDRLLGQITEDLN